MVALIRNTKNVVAPNFVGTDFIEIHTLNKMLFVGSKITPSRPLGPVMHRVDVPEGDSRSPLYSLMDISLSIILIAFSIITSSSLVNVFF